MVLIGIMTALLYPEIGNLRDRAEKVICMGHLRSLHCSLGAYLNDNEQWPQCPEEADKDTEEKFWLDTLKDYGATENVWQCPTLLRRLAGDTSEDVPRLHYTPTQFDDNPMTPRRWVAMPWLIEISDVHHGGNLLIRTDGSVQNVDQAMIESQKGG